MGLFSRVGRKLRQVHMVPTKGNPVGKQFFQCKMWADLRDELAKVNVDLRSSKLKDVPATTDLAVIWDLFPDDQTLRQLERIPHRARVLISAEPPTVAPFNHLRECHDLFAHVFTWNDTLKDGIKFHKFHFTQWHTPLERWEPFASRQLVTLMAGNKASSHPFQLYSERRRVIEYFESLGGSDFEFYGTKWQFHGYKTYRGSPKDKLSTLSRYRFCICYENCKGMAGYITEKIFDCFAAGCVPVYLGAPNIADYIPEQCFIRREQFQGDAEMHTFLKQMGEKQHQSYLDAIRQFLKSSQAKIFTDENLMQTYLQGIKQMLGIHKE